jgi:hypothetical protein
MRDHMHDLNRYCNFSTFCEESGLNGCIGRLHKYSHQSHALACRWRTTRISFLERMSMVQEQSRAEQDERQAVLRTEQRSLSHLLQVVEKGYEERLERAAARLEKAEAEAVQQRDAYRKAMCDLVSSENVPGLGKKHKESSTVAPSTGKVFARRLHTVRLQSARGLERHRRERAARQLQHAYR